MTWSRGHRQGQSRHGHCHGYSYSCRQLSVVVRVTLKVTVIAFRDSKFDSDNVSGLDNDYDRDSASDSIDSDSDSIDSDSVGDRNLDHDR